MDVEHKNKKKSLDRGDVGRIVARAKGNRRVPLQTIILGTLCVTGVLAVGLVAPKVLGLFEYLNPISRRNTMRFNQRITQALLRLERNGLIHVTGEGRKREIHLTQQGEEKTDALYAGAYVIPLPVRWDGKWRTVMFDVPERRRAVRDKLRAAMKSLGFVRLQDSAWVYPYDCEDLVALLKAELKIGFSVLYLVVEHIENDKFLRQEFGFKS